MIVDIVEQRQDKREGGMAIPKAYTQGVRTDAARQETMKTQKGRIMQV
jgi:hypothetical protein